MCVIEKTVAFVVWHLNPPSTNHLYQPTMYTGRDGFAHRGRKLTKETKAYYDAVAIFARGRTVAPATPKERKKVRYGVRIDVYLPVGGRGDFDNFWKAGCDGLVKAGVIHSDAAVDGEYSKCVVHRDDRENPRTEYQITRLENECHI